MKKVFRKFPLFALIGLLLLELAIPLLANVKTYAASYTGAWVDNSTIIIGPSDGKHATYSKDGTGNYSYKAPAPDDKYPVYPDGAICPNTIVVNSGDNSKGKITLSQWGKPPGNQPENVGKSLRYKCHIQFGGKAQSITLTD